MKTTENSCERTYHKTQIMIIDKIKDLDRRKELQALIHDVWHEYLSLKEGAEAFFFEKMVVVTEQIAAAMNATK